MGLKPGPGPKNPGQVRPISLFFVTFLLMKEEEEAQQTLLKLEYILVSNSITTLQMMKRCDPL